MSDTFSRVEIITGVARRRRFTTEQKLAVVAETMQPGMSISYVACRHGPSPSLVFRWRRLMTEGGQKAVRADDDVVPAADVRRLEERVRELERQLGRKTLEVEILKEAGLGLTLTGPAHVGPGGGLADVQSATKPWHASALRQSLGSSTTFAATCFSRA